MTRAAVENIFAPVRTDDDASQIVIASRRYRIVGDRVCFPGRTSSSAARFAGAAQKRWDRWRWPHFALVRRLLKIPAEDPC